MRTRRDPTSDVISLGEATRAWFRVSLQTFGGPAGQIAVMHRELVDERRWIGEERFLHALSYCTLLPGPEAQQLAIYLGWLLNGTAGGLIAGTLFVLPGFLAIMALSVLYAGWGDTLDPGPCASAREEPRASRRGAAPARHGPPVLRREVVEDLTPAEAHAFPRAVLT